MKFIILAAGILSSGLLATVPARAVPTLSMRLTTSTGATTGVLTDTNHTGLLTFTGKLGLFSANVTSGSGFGSINPSGDGSIDLTSKNIASHAAGQLTIEFTETDLTGMAAEANYISTIGGTLGRGNDKIVFSTYIDPGDVAFATTDLLATRLFSGTNTTFGADMLGAGQASSLFSLTEIVSLSAAAGATNSFDASLIPVPEPIPVALLGVGIVGLGLARRAKPRDNTTKRLSLR